MNHDENTFDATVLADVIDDLDTTPPGEEPEQQRKTGLKRWLPIVKIAISTLLIWWVLSRAPIGQVLAAMRTADLRYLIGAFCLLPLGVVMGTFRWSGLLEAHSKHFRFAFLWASNMVSLFVKQFLPSTIGGDAVKMYDSWRGGAPKSVAVTAVVVDRIFGLMVLALFVCGAVVFWPDTPGGLPVRIGAFGGAACLVGFIAWVFIPGPKPPAFVIRLWRAIPHKLRHPFDRLLLAIEAYAGEHGVFARSLGLSILLQLNVVLFYWLIAMSLGFEVTYAHMLLNVPIAIFVMMVPITINGIGLRESVWMLLLGMHGVEQAQAVAFGWIEFALFLGLSVMGGIVYAFRR